MAKLGVKRALQQHRSDTEGDSRMVKRLEGSLHSCRGWHNLCWYTFLRQASCNARQRTTLTTPPSKSQLGSSWYAPVDLIELV